MSSTYFSFPDADLVLRSGDPNPVDFHVHRCVLATASPFFRDMLSLPQAPSEKVEVPVVPVSENHRTLEGLLRFVYPMPDPPVETLDEISSLLGAATKYDMTAAIDVLRRLLVAPQYVQASPTRVYAIASRYDLEEEAKIASRHTLGIDVLNCPLHEDLKYITAYAYHRLLNLHKRRAEAALELLKITEDVKCMVCNGMHYGAFSPPRWWDDFVLRAKDELRARPTSDVVFSMAFLAQSAQAGCERCGGSILAAHAFLEELKKNIDALPSTI